MGYEDGLRNLSLYQLYYVKACNKFTGPISASLCPGNTAPFEDMPQRWRAVGNTVSYLAGLRFEPQTSRYVPFGAELRKKIDKILY